MRFWMVFLLVSMVISTEKYIYAVPESKASLLVEEAKLAYASQHKCEAQELFLEALCACQPQEETPISAEEQKVIESLLPLYALSSLNSSQKLKEEVDSLMKKHKDFYSLGFFKATLYANEDDFIPFFDTFFTAYKKHPDFFLSWKIRGVLHLRLFEASSSENKRIWHRDKSVVFLQNAFSRRPSDASLIVKLVFLLPNEEKKKLLESVADGISRIEIPLQRGECMYLIEQAIELSSLEVAKILIEKAHMWYQYSRGLQELTKRLQQLEADKRGICD